MCYNDTMSQLETSMRKAMKRSGKPRYRLWQVTGISQSQLSRFTKGTAGLSYDAMERLADALGRVVARLPKAKAPARGAGLRMDKESTPSRRVKPRGGPHHRNKGH